jgi:hypothetical protein
MIDDAEARDAVRQLRKRFEFIAAQAGAMAYVLAKETRGNMPDYWNPPK